MRAWESYAPQKGFDSDDRLRNDPCRRFKGYDMRERTGGGCAAKRTVRELDVTSRVVVHMLRGPLRSDAFGTELEHKRRTV
jgi:hypothetical protein